MKWSKDGIYDAWHWMPEEFKSLVAPGFPESIAIGYHAWHAQMWKWEGKRAKFDAEFPPFEAHVRKTNVMKVLKEG